MSPRPASREMLAQPCWRMNACGSLAMRSSSSMSPQFPGFVDRLGEEFVGLAPFQTWIDSPETAFAHATSRLRLRLIRPDSRHMAETCSGQPGWSPRRRGRRGFATPLRIWPFQTWLKAGGLATRKPTLLFSLVGVLLLRLDEARLFELLFHEPPRNPRDEPSRSVARCPCRGSWREHLAAQAPCVGMAGMGHP